MEKFDGGWGYMVLLGMFISQMLFGLTLRSFGAIYLVTLENYQTTATVASWIGSTNVLIFGLFSPVASFLCQKFSCRFVAALGSIFMASGFLLTAFAFHVTLLFISFGLLCGIGLACLSASAFLVVTLWFKKRRALASSIGSSGAGIALLVMPPLVEFFTSYYGFQGCMLLLSAISLHGFISALLYKPHTPCSSHVTLVVQNTDTNHDTSNTSPNIEAIQCETNANQLQASSVPHNTHLVPAIKSPNNQETQPLVKNVTNAKDKKSPSIVNIKNTKCHEKEPFDSALSIETSVVEFEEKEGVTLQKLNNSSLKKFPVLSVLKKEPRVTGLLFMMFAMTISSTSISTYAPAFAVETGVVQIKAVLLLSYAGVADTLGRIFIGFIMDLKIFRPVRIWLYLFCGIITSTMVIIYPLVPHYIWFCCVIVVQESFNGILFAQRATMLGDILGQQQMMLLFGVMQTMTAIGVVVARGAGGIIKDGIGSYSYIFYICGSLASVVVVAVIIIHVVHKSRNVTNSSKNIDS